MVSVGAKVLQPEVGRWKWAVMTLAKKSGRSTPGLVGEGLWLGPRAARRGFPLVSASEGGMFRFVKVTPTTPALPISSSEKCAYWRAPSSSTRLVFLGVEELFC